MNEVGGLLRELDPQRPQFIEHEISQFTISQLTVARLKRHRPSLQSTGFTKHLRKLCQRFEIKLDPFSRVPDAWEYVEGKGGSEGDLVVIEIEDTNKLTPAKLYDYAELWFALDFYGIGLQLFVTDRYGNLQPQIDLCDWWYTIRGVLRCQR